MERKKIVLLCKKWFLPVVILLLSGCASGIGGTVAGSVADGLISNAPKVRNLDHRLDVLENMVLGNSADIRTLRNNVHNANDVASERIDEIEKYIKRIRFRNAKPSKKLDLFSL